MIFPEGRITNGQMLIQFKLGAFHAGESIAPVLLRYPWSHFNPACCGRNAGPLWPLRMMTQWANHCQVELLEDYIPTAAAKSDPAAYASEVREMMSMVAELPTTEHTYDDAFLFRSAQAASVGTDFEVQNMRELFDVDLAQLQRWLSMFQSMDKNGDGLLQQDDFERAIAASFPNAERVPASLDKLFRFFDTDGSGVIEYRELVQGLALFSGRCDAESMAKLAFLLYDVEGHGKVSYRMLRSALDNAFALAPSLASSNMRQDFAQRASRSFLKRRNTTPVHSWRTPRAQRACSSGCGFAATWDTTHCCIACASQAGQHGLTCERVVIDEDTPQSPCAKQRARRQMTSVGQELLPNPESADEELMDYETFMDLMRKNPQILQKALDQVYRRMGWKEFDPDAPKECGRLEQGVV